LEALSRSVSGDGTIGREKNKQDIFQVGDNYIQQDLLNFQGIVFSSDLAIFDIHQTECRPMRFYGSCAELGFLRRPERRSP